MSQLSKASIRMPETVRHRRNRSESSFHTDDKRYISDYNKSLIEELWLLKRKLNEKTNELDKLVELRDKLESEIIELSEALFQQAYAKVNAAQEETVQTQKLLDQAKAQIDELNAQVKHLKEFCLTLSLKECESLNIKRESSMAPKLYQEK